MDIVGGDVPSLVKAFAGRFTSVNFETTLNDGPLAGKALLAGDGWIFPLSLLLYKKSVTKELSILNI